ncbi:MAG: hypothetical protein ABJE95_23255 [Byssovorax sp.]
MKLALVSILAVASLSLAGCDDKKPEPAKPTGTTAPAAAAPAPAAKGTAAPAGW